MTNFKTERAEGSPHLKKYSQEDLLNFYIDRYNKLLEENERLRETLRKYRGH